MRNFVLAFCVFLPLLLTSGFAHARDEAPIGDIASAELPGEARETLALIRQGGPFPYAQDGAVFGNRERILPQKERGYYREYTVKTPGAKDRGARRIVAGRSGEFYYSGDHYNSFRSIGK
jgi:ribonuclease T1